MRSTSNKPGWTDKELGRRALSIGVLASTTSTPETTADRLLHDEFTHEELQRANAYLQSGAIVTGR
ncbi:hypothetical protein [Streptomyces sp. SID10815]|uniref:hypothetical protein n=1 Tax=Streptomyces sp. SID10815 TaxID=2706027 RepID=UPI0013CB4F8B|nr:hypothetical protein [Streptomyces sp. SID10815]NEA52394.1 hypothetical protein [Streptomyces sp. SID10815]